MNALCSVTQKICAVTSDANIGNETVVVAWRALKTITLQLCSIQKRFSSETPRALVNACIGYVSTSLDDVLCNALSELVEVYSLEEKFEAAVGEIKGTLVNERQDADTSHSLALVSDGRDVSDGTTSNKTAAGSERIIALDAPKVHHFTISCWFRLDASAEGSPWVRLLCTRFVSTDESPSIAPEIMYPALMLRFDPTAAEPLMLEMRIDIPQETGAPATRSPWKLGCH